VTFDSLTPGALQRFTYLARLPQVVPRPSFMEFASPTEPRGPC
jgi:hypothetical protein